MTPTWTIVGQGLAGTCLAWEFWKRGAGFQIIDQETGGSSRVAAGLINPITGKNFEPSTRVADFLPQALTFYAEIEHQLARKFWHPLPILRLASDAREWSKMTLKSNHPEVIPWLAADGKGLQINGWAGAMKLCGGGRLDTRLFLDESRCFFKNHNIYQKSPVPPDSGGAHVIWCEGAAGLLLGKYGEHRCAKGEILTLRAEDWDESHIRIGAGGWLVPLGNGIFKAGSTYEWNQLDETPTPAGRQRIGEIANRLGGGSFQTIAHDAGIRPILRRSKPWIGPIPAGGWMFNGLGSKGSLYAPGIAARLADWILNGVEPEPEVDFRNSIAGRIPPP